MTECQGNPASTPKVSPTYRPTAKRMAACRRQGYGRAEFEGGTGAGWPACAVLVSGSMFCDIACRIRKLAL